MTVAYPLNLRTIIRANKSRSQPAAFRMSQPRRGWGYVEASGSDTPVFWDVMFRFTTCEAGLFQLWFTQTLLRGVLEFTMPIRTEFGLQTHTVLFVPDSLLPVRETGEIWEYTATIMARAQVIPSGAIAAYAATFNGPIPDQNFVVGAMFSLALAGYWTAGTGPYTYEIVSGRLPLGMSLDRNTGIVSGVPTSTAAFDGVVFGRRDVYCVLLPSNLVQFANVVVTATMTIVSADQTGLTQTKPTPFDFKVDGNSSSASAFYRAYITTQTTGLRYIEFENIGSGGASTGRGVTVGFTATGTPAGSPVSNTIDAMVTNLNYSGGSVGYFLNGSGATNSAYDFVQGNSVCMAIEHSSGKVWVRINGAAWIGGGDPVALTSPTFTMSAGTYQPVIYVYNRGGGFTCNFEVRAKLAGDTMSYTIPAGFSAYH